VETIAANIAMFRAHVPNRRTTGAFTAVLH
jgi:hypothetical protein